MKDLLLYIIIIIGIMSIFCLGWLSHDIYQIYDYERNLDGFHMSYANITMVEEYQELNDPYGDWVAVNVRDMNYPRAYEVCVHECSHKAYSEIYAEKCEYDFESCMEDLK